MTPPKGSRPLAALVAGVALLVPAVTAAPAAADGVSIAPSRIEADVRVGDRLPPVVVRNGGRAPVEVRVTVARAGQDLSGLPVFGDDGWARRAGEGFVAVTPSRIRLPAGAARRLQLRIAGRPGRRSGQYGVVLVSARRAGDADAGAAVVTPVVRLSANLLLRFPGRQVVDGRAARLRAEQGPGRTLRFVSTLAARGTVHGTPRLALRIRDARGRLVVRRRVTGATVLPGARRELPALVRQLLPAGRYVAVVEATHGRRRSVARHAFTLVGPNRLPTADLRITGLPVPRPEPGDDFEARVGVANRGTGPVEARGRLEIRALGDDRVLRAAPLPTGVLGPGARGELTAPVEGLEEGAYVLRARFAEDARVLDERELVFRVEAGTPWLDRLLDWLSAHVALVVAACLALLLLVGVGAALLVRRARRQARRALAEVATPVVAPPAVAEETAALAREMEAVASAPRAPDPEPERPSEPGTDPSSAYIERLRRLREPAGPR